MFRKYNDIPLLMLVVGAATLAIILYSIGASFLAEPIKMGDAFISKSIAGLAKDSLFVPLKPLMYALIIMSIGSSLAISRGGLGGKFVRILSLFVMYSVIGAVIAVLGYTLFQAVPIFGNTPVFSSPTGVTGSSGNIKQIPFALKIYGVLTSPLMISIYAGVIFGRALKALELGRQADAISDLFMTGFRAFLQVTIPLAVFGSITLALNSPGGVATLYNLLPMVGVYAVLLITMWGVLFAGTCLFLRKSPSFVFRAVAPQALVAFSTSSSIATLPATKVACEQLGASGDESTPFFTIGATINMVGTLMGMAILCFYAMDGFGLELSMADKVVVALQALIYSVSAAGVPSASVVLVQEILTSQGVSAEYATYVTGLIITMDTLILDRLRTALNTQSDSMSTVTGLHLYYKKPAVLDV